MPNILFLCTGNSARSIMAESYATHASNATWTGWSAGSNPTGKPNPFALETLRNNGVEPVSGDGGPVRSKSWDEFAAEDAPLMDVVVTVCDNAAGETCPIWPVKPGGKQPEKLHWSFPDPAAEQGTDEQKRTAFEWVFHGIRERIDAFLDEHK